jgi:ribonuclease I
MNYVLQLPWSGECTNIKNHDNEKALQRSNRRRTGLGMETGIASLRQAVNTF